MKPTRNKNRSRVAEDWILCGDLVEVKLDADDEVMIRLAGLDSTVIHLQPRVLEKVVSFAKKHAKTRRV